MFYEPCCGVFCDGGLPGGNRGVITGKEKCVSIKQNLLSWRPGRLDRAICKIKTVLMPVERNENTFTLLCTRAIKGWVIQIYARNNDEV